MKKVFFLLFFLIFLVVPSSSIGSDKHYECLELSNHIYSPKPLDDCLVDKKLQKYIDCRHYYEQNMLNGLDHEGKEKKDGLGAMVRYKLFNDDIKKVLYKDLENVKNKSLGILCEKDTLYDFQEILITQDHCYSDRFISAFGSDADMSKASIKSDYFKPVYELINAHLESKEKPKKKIELCDSYLKCLSFYVHTNHADVSENVKNLYQKTLKECAPGYYTITTTIKRKEESRKERRGNSMVAGPRNFITTNIVESKSKQLMYVNAKSGRVILLPIKEKDSSRANLQSYKFDGKACRYDLVTDTQIDKHIKHKQATVLSHDIGLVDDDKANIVFQVRSSGLKKKITINWKNLENNRYVSKKDTYKKETQRYGGISFGGDYDKKQDKAASLVLENIPVGKKGGCQVRAVHDGFIGEGSSQFDLGFEYDIEINQASMDDINTFRTSTVSDQWEYRAIKKKKKKPSEFDKEPSGILDLIESEAYGDLSNDDKKEWDDVADSENSEEEFEGMTIDDLEMFTN